MATEQPRASDHMTDIELSAEELRSAALPQGAARPNTDLEEARTLLKIIIVFINEWPTNAPEDDTEAINRQIRRFLRKTSE